MEYSFSERKFIESFNAKSIEEKSVDAMRLTHKPDNEFKLFPYKASGKIQAPIVTELEDVVCEFFREVFRIKTDEITFEELCEDLFEEIDIEDEDKDFFKDMVQSMFFRNNNFIASNIGLYQYQTTCNNKSAENLAHFLFSVLGINEQNCEFIEEVKAKCKYNVLENMVIEIIESKKVTLSENRQKYFCVNTDIQEKFREDFCFMLESGMTSLEDISDLFSLYYFYYVSQTCFTLDKFLYGKRDEKVKLYFALDWEKVSKNRLCCTLGWELLQGSINHMFSHAITLEILNQTESKTMMDYISFGEFVLNDPYYDEIIAQEIIRAESIYCSYVGDFKGFSNIPYQSIDCLTEKAIIHLFKCVEAQFVNTERKRANQFYNEKFSMGEQLAIQTTTKKQDSDAKDGRGNVLKATLLNNEKE